MSDSLFVTVEDAARLLGGISTDLVYDLIHRGELPCATFGRRKMIPARAIDLVIERALEGFDPDALLATLARAVGPSSASGGPSAGASTIREPDVDARGAGPTGLAVVASLPAGDASVIAHRR